MILQAWHKVEDSRSIQIGVDHEGRCFKRYRDAARSRYQWPPWQYLTQLDPNALPNTIDGCVPITHRNGWRKWRFPKSTC